MKATEKLGMKDNASGYYNAFSVSLSDQGCFADYMHLWTYIFRTVYSLPVKNDIGILMKITLNLWVSLSKMVTFLKCSLVTCS